MTDDAKRIAEIRYMHEGGMLITDEGIDKLLAHIDAQATRVVELEAELENRKMYEARNCDRINERLRLAVAVVEAYRRLGHLPCASIEVLKMKEVCPESSSKCDNCRANDAQHSGAGENNDG